MGLGNPGQRFERTRHNVGFDVVRRVAALSGLQLRKRLFRPCLWSGPGEFIVATPLTYMNRSGTVVPWLMKASGATVDQLVVVCDNMDLEPGLIRMKRTGTSRAHNGIASVVDALGTGAFCRLYVGIGRPGEGETVVEHVLSAPDGREQPLYATAIERAAQALTSLAHDDVERVMNTINARR